jgi:spore maturation protein CgeB
MLTTYPDIIKKYHADGISNVLLTQWAADSRSFGEPLPASQCKYQVSFVGAAHGNRKRRIKQLRETGIHVSCFGYGWPEGTIAAEEIPRIMKNSIISLNFANSKGLNQIKARTFEVPGSGGFLLTEDAPGLEKFYMKGKEIEVFNDIKTLKNKIEYYLSNPDERNSIAKAGFERTRLEHTYEIRMTKIIDFAIDAKNKFPSKKESTDLYIPMNFGISHRMNLTMKILKLLLLWPCVTIWGNKRGRRAARKIVFEISWRLFGKATFTESGWPGRMFPEV